ncbi:MAG: citrate synthase, partial [Proteobacteria bacterium]|nr:citrate synthase [Pseudomonadota bacterium]
MPEPIYVSAREAAAELNISRATLYAYVSRGLIESIADPGARTRQYALADVRALRRGAVGADAQVGQEARALDFGAPLLDSRLTTIRDGRLYYLGRD